MSTQLTFSLVLLVTTLRSSVWGEEVASASEIVAKNIPRADSVQQAANHAVVHRRGAWFIAVTDNFQVCSLTNEVFAREMASSCELLRRHVADRCALSPASWTPRCQVVLHANDASYVAAVGDASRSTLASALVSRREGRIRQRQIDVRGDVADFLVAALPHELCHILLADRFDAAPLWLDEGLALQFDTLAKRRLHDRDLRQGLAKGAAYPLETLFALRAYPQSEHWPLFYGQTASVVGCLLQVGGPSSLIEFAKLQETRGVDGALRETYGITGVAELDSRWRDSIAAIQTSAATLPLHISKPVAMLQPLDALEFAKAR